MQLDPISLVAIGGVGTIGGLLITGITFTFFWYYLKLLFSTKRRVEMKGHHRIDLKLAMEALREMGYAHVGYFFLSIVLLFAATQTGAFEPTRNFYIIASLALFFWFCMVPGRGVLALRDMIRILNTPLPASPPVPQTDVPGPADAAETQASAEGSDSDSSAQPVADEAEPAVPLPHLRAANG